MRFNTRFFIQASLVNLLLVAALGVVMRYKILYSLPFLDQKHLQHAHSHFAFAGWVTHLLYVLIVNFLAGKGLFQNSLAFNKYLIINLACAYAMLLSFFFSGYSALSIGILTLALINTVVFTRLIFKTLNQPVFAHPSVPWIKSALWFNLISSAGTFYLAYLKVSHNFNEYWYLASVYFYLHFQYNGFFTFTCMGLALDYLPKLLPGFKQSKQVFVLFLLACPFTYFLSTLWASLPNWLYVLTVVAAFVQAAGWLLLLKNVRAAWQAAPVPDRLLRFMLMYVAIAFSVKLALQLGSTIPEVSKLAFGFRPVVIAYLHLVLLALISMFLLLYLYANQFLLAPRSAGKALLAVLVAVFLNELALAVQGVASFSYFPVKHINEVLLGIALLIFGACLWLVLTQKKAATTRDLAD